MAENIIITADGGVMCIVFLKKEDTEGSVLFPIIPQKVISEAGRSMALTALKDMFLHIFFNAI